MNDDAPPFSYEKGYVDGLTAFAHMKDGEYFVGTTGMTLAVAKRSFLVTRGFDEEQINALVPETPAERHRRETMYRCACTHTISSHAEDGCLVTDCECTRPYGGEKH